MGDKKNLPPHILLAHCPSRKVLELIADQWTVMVITALEEGTRRFSELLEKIEGISKKMLTQTLRALERDGLVQRVVYPVVPPMVEYSLTPLGQTLHAPMQALREWAYSHMREVDASRNAYDEASHPLLPDTTAALVSQR